METSHGRVKARVPSDLAVRTGETVGLNFRTPRLSLFDAASGRALRMRRAGERPPMAEIRVQGASKSLRPGRGRAGPRPRSSRTASFVVLLGPTGAGKTTTLRLIAGLEKPDRGTVAIGGHDVTALPPAARDVAFVFQQYSLYPHLTVFDNLAFPLRSPARRLPEDAIRRRVQEVADLLHIAPKLQNKATRLSGGEMQRVAIGRALVRQPVGLPDGRTAVVARRQAARGIAARAEAHPADLGATMLYVTHDQIEAMTMATHIGVLKRGPARPVRHAAADL